MKKIIKDIEYDFPECEVCGELANNIVRDYFIDDGDVRGIRELSPNNNSIHHFCDKHNRGANGEDVTTSPLTRFYSSQEKAQQHNCAQPQHGRDTYVGAFGLLMCSECNQPVEKVVE